MATETRGARPIIRRPTSDIARLPRTGALGAGRAIAEGAPRSAPSAPLTIASQVARGVLEAAAIAALVLAVVLWADALFGRV